MRYIATYDLMETARTTNQWLGATAQAFGNYPAIGIIPNPMIQMMAAWGKVTEHAFSRMITKPDWGIDSVVAEDGRDHVIAVESIVSKPFGDLIHFKAVGREPRARLLT